VARLNLWFLDSVGFRISISIPIPKLGALGKRPFSLPNEYFFPAGSFNICQPIGGEASYFGEAVFQKGKHPC
jgi:hypothetical protein